MNVTVKDWQTSGSPASPYSRLLAQVTVNEHPMHLEAYEVHDGNEGCQEAADPYFTEEVDHILSLTGTALQTTEIDGRTYILVATSHGA